MTRMRQLREAKGLSQAQLAEKIGCGQSYIAHLERGRRDGATRTLKKIADALGVTVDELIKDEETERPA